MLHKWAGQEQHHRHQWRARLYHFQQGAQAPVHPQGVEAGNDLLEQVVVHASAPPRQEAEVQVASERATAARHAAARAAAAAVAARQATKLVQDRKQDTDLLDSTALGAAEGPVSDAARSSMPDQSQVAAGSEQGAMHSQRK